tara:strand:- start:436 stop:609 length:174 start_codon:yes stop_codon:yes gene_type:complete
MSDLEQLIWNILGYSSMPFIFLFGFIATALVAVVILKVFGAKPTPVLKDIVKANEKL